MEASPGIAPFPAPIASAQGGNNQVALTWQPATFYATSYNVYRGTSPGGKSATPVGSGLSSSATTYTNSGVVNGNTYYYEVGAANAYRRDDV